MLKIWQDVGSKANAYALKENSQLVRKFINEENMDYASMSKSEQSELLYAIQNLSANDSNGSRDLAFAAMEHINSNAVRETGIRKR